MVPGEGTLTRKDALTPRIRGLGEEAQSVEIRERDLLICMLVDQIILNDADILLGAKVHGLFVAGIGNVRNPGLHEKRVLKLDQLLLVRRSLAGLGHQLRSVDLAGVLLGEHFSLSSCWRLIFFEEDRFRFWLFCDFRLTLVLIHRHGGLLDVCFARFWAVC